MIGLVAIPERLPSIACNLHGGQIPRRRGDLNRSHIKSNWNALQATQVNSFQFMLARFSIRICRFPTRKRRFLRKRRWNSAPKNNLEPRSVQGKGRGPGKANSMGQDIAERHQQHDGV